VSNKPDFGWKGLTFHNLGLVARPAEQMTEAVQDSGQAVVLADKVGQASGGVDLDGDGVLHFFISFSFLCDFIILLLMSNKTDFQEWP
jgi:hypothetical protein